MLPCVEGPNPSYFVYYSEVVLQDDGGSPVIWVISITEYVVLSLLRFPATSQRLVVTAQSVSFAMITGEPRWPKCPSPSTVRCLPCGP